MTPRRPCFPAVTALLSLLAAAAASPAATVAQWTFDTGAQDWTPNFPSGTGIGSVYQSAGGNPGGYLRATDRTGFQGIGPWSFALTQTPADYSAAYDGSLSFDLRSFGTPGTAFAAADVQLAGAGFTLVTDAGVQPGSGWSTFAVDLNPAAGWHLLTTAGAQPTAVQFQAVLAALQTVQIRGDFTTGSGTTPGSAGFDDTGLDNVAFLTPAAAPTGVPLPSAGAGGIALCGLVGLARKRRADTA